MTIVQSLRKSLPSGFMAAPRVHLGRVEIDVAAFEPDLPSTYAGSDNGGGVATAVWAPARPTLAVETSLPDMDEYQVRVYDSTHERRLVAAIEIVSPANKDRSEHRSLFVAQCASLLQQHVAVSIVDLVTERSGNLYADLLAFIGQSDRSLGQAPPPIYAASVRWVEKGTRQMLEAWSNALVVGQPLPTLPLWLAEDLVVPLKLEESYEQACSDLWITE